jgi:hypothetical protein
MGDFCYLTVLPENTGSLIGFFYKIGLSLQMCKVNGEIQRRQSQFV